MHVPLESILLALAEFELCFFHQLFSLQNQILKNFGTRTLLTAAPSGNKANKMAPRQKLSKYDFKIFSKLHMRQLKLPSRNWKATMRISTMRTLANTRNLYFGC